MDWKAAFERIHGKVPDLNEEQQEVERPAVLQKPDMLLKLKMTPVKNTIRIKASPSTANAFDIGFNNELLSASPIRATRGLTNSCRKKLESLAARSAGLRQDSACITNLAQQLETVEPEQPVVENDENSCEEYKTEAFVVSPRKKRCAKKDQGNFVKINMRCKKHIVKKKTHNKFKFRKSKKTF